MEYTDKPGENHKTDAVYETSREGRKSKACDEVID